MQKLSEENSLRNVIFPGSVMAYSSSDKRIYAMLKSKTVDADFIRFLSMYESLDPDQQADVLSLMKKWAEKNPQIRQITERIATRTDEKSNKNNDKQLAASQELKRALDQMPASQSRLETIDQLNRKLLKSVKKQDQIAVHTMLNDLIRDAHWGIYELNSAYHEYQQALADSRLGAGMDQ